MASKKQIVTNNRIWASELKGLAHAADIEAHARFILCCVNVKMWKGGEYQLTATNSYEIVVVNPDAPDAPDEEYSIKAEYLKKLKASDDYVTLEPYNEYSVIAHIESKRGKQRNEVWEMQDTKYPRWRQMLQGLNNEPDTNYAIDYKLLAQTTKAISEAAKWMKPKNFPLQFSKSTNKPFIQVKNPLEKRYLGIIMPMVV